MCNCFSKNLGLGEGSALPVGVPVPWPSATPPTGWLKCNGAPFSAEEYPKLAKAYPTNKLPDLRAEFIRGWDDGRGGDSGRQLLSQQAATSVTGTVYNDEAGEGYLKIAPLNYDSIIETKNAFTSNGTISASGIGRYTVRPRNIAFNYIVRAA
ncbi:tail fiber protein [Escherichia coli]|nr:tail fiber protein [Escherichia coli]